MREWQDLHGQLRAAARDLGIRRNRAEVEPDADRVHTALLAGLLSHIGLRQGDTREYLGARGTRFAIFPGSALARKPPQWVMAAELVETSRLWGREAARIEPEWAEELAAHLVKRTYAEPHWSRSRGAVVATERVTLYGVPIVTGRQVDYGRIDPGLARELFLRHALVEGDWETSHGFFARNRRLLDEVEELEHRARRRDILVDDHALFDFYDRRVPDEVVSARHFDAWWKQTRQERPDLLDFERSMLIEDAAGAPDADEYPDTWTQGGHRLRLTYQFEPGSDADGVTVHVPLAVLNQVEPDGFDWQVPGLRQELVTELIRSLPKAIRRSFIPAPNWAASVLEKIGPADGPLLEVLARELERSGPVEVPPERLRPGQGARPPAHDLPGGRPGGGPPGPRPGPGGRRGQGPGPAQAAAGPADAGRHRRRRARPGARPGHHLGPRHPAPGGGGGRRRPGRQGVPGPGGGGRRRWPCGCWRPRPSRPPPCGPAPAGCCSTPIPSPVKFVLGRQTNQAKLTLSALPARQRHRPVRRLPGRGGRRPDRRQRRPGLGRGRASAGCWTRSGRSWPTSPWRWSPGSSGSWPWSGRSRAAWPRWPTRPSARPPATSGPSSTTSSIRAG